MPLLQMSLALEEDASNLEATEWMAVERQEISRMVKCRMSSLGLPLDDYSEPRFEVRGEGGLLCHLFAYTVEFKRPLSFRRKCWSPFSLRLWRWRGMF